MQLLATTWTTGDGGNFYLRHYIHTGSETTQRNREGYFKEDIRAGA
jgi:hypothetical protein